MTSAASCSAARPPCNLGKPLQGETFIGVKHLTHRQRFGTVSQLRLLMLSDLIQCSDLKVNGI